MKKLLLPTLAIVFILASCSGQYGSATPGYWSPALPGDTTARFGVLIEQTKPIGGK